MERRKYDGWKMGIGLLDVKGLLVACSVWEEFGKGGVNTLEVILLIVEA